MWDPIVYRLYTKPIFLLRSKTNMYSVHFHFPLSIRTGDQYTIHNAGCILRFRLDVGYWGSGFTMQPECKVHNVHM